MAPPRLRAGPRSPAPRFGPFTGVPVGRELGPWRRPVYPRGMDPVHREVARFLSRASVSRLAPVLVAVSGGPDSVALLHILSRLGQRLGVAHVHHGLRGAEADADQGAAAALAAALGLRFHRVRLPPAGSGTEAASLSPEARARSLRYAALEQIRAREGYTWVATGHTRDDQAETVLLRAVRGTDLAGLGSIEPRSEPRRLLRPLLTVPRDVLRGYLRERRLSWRHDRSNDDLGIPRNRIRKNVLGELEAAHPGAIEHLARLADAAREWRGALDLRLERSLTDLTVPAERGYWLHTAGLARLPGAERRALLAELLRRLGAGHRLTRAHLERLDRWLTTGTRGRALSLPCALVLLRDYDRHWIGPAPGPVGPCALEPLHLSPGASLWLPERDLRLSWLPTQDGPDTPRVRSTNSPPSPPGGAPSAVLRLALEDPPAAALCVRSPREEDRWGSEQAGRVRRLTDVFSSERWPHRVRRSAIVVEDGEQILWVLGCDGEAGSDVLCWRTLAASRRQIGPRGGGACPRVGPRGELRAARVSATSQAW